MSVKTLPLKDLKVDRRYQRGLDQRRVKKIAEGLDERQLGVLEVSKRNGSFSIIDGQHRFAALKKAGKNSANCLIHEGLTPKEEADLFVHFQLDRKNLRPWERFIAQVFSGDPKSVEIDRAVRRHGFVVRKGEGKPNHIEAVVSLERLYEWGGIKLVDDTLKIAAKVWKGDEGITNGYFLRGLGLLLLDYPAQITPQALKRLREVSPLVILRRGLGQATYGGGSMAAKAVSVELRKAAGVNGRPRKRKRGDYPGISA